MATLVEGGRDRVPDRKERVAVAPGRIRTSCLADAARLRASPKPPALDVSRDGAQAGFPRYIGPYAPPPQARALPVTATKNPKPASAKAPKTDKNSAVGDD